MTYLPYLLMTVYILSGAIAHGLVFGYFQNTYPSLAEKNYNSDFLLSFTMGMLGPIGLISAVISVFNLSIHGYKGFKLY